MDCVWEIYLHNTIRNMLTKDKSTMAENMYTNEIPHQSLFMFLGPETNLIITSSGLHFILLMVWFTPPLHKIKYD